MVIFPIIIIVSAVFYIYYKVAILKEKNTLTQKYFNGRARSCLGAFLIAFAINQYTLYLTQLSLFIGLVIFALGLMQLIRGFKEARHYQKEWRRLYPQ
ncbi:YtpI family protein [Oceanobacillus jeddahense]|uniref:YtpI family protein n=1 Tax=Oceanobacillus jeddahense TaxID=1462527 RepID=A0ABY5JN45_9BACI|nr:YtpI family protein [Oceanobacillus jeddahense]UUI01725.1 YtpI family protein [Oceanobacillus jeddahense]